MEIQIIGFFPFPFEDIDVNFMSPSLAFLENAQEIPLQPAEGKKLKQAKCEFHRKPLTSTAPTTER